jgi:hypothetical protein
MRGERPLLLPPRRVAPEACGRVWRIVEGAAKAALEIGRG